MKKPTMQDAIKQYEYEIKIGIRILVEIDGIPVYATKKDVLEAVKAYKTVKRIK